MSTVFYEPTLFEFPAVWHELNPTLISGSYNSLMTNTRKYVRHVPRGYYVKEEDTDRICHPLPEILEQYVELLIESRYKNNRSYKETLEIIHKIDEGYLGKDFKKLSEGGLSKLFDRLEIDLGIFTKDTSHQRIKRLRKEYREKIIAETGSAPQHLSRANQKKREAQKKLTASNKEIKEAEKKLKSLKKESAKNARKLELAKDPTKYVESKESPGELEYQGSTTPQKTEAPMIKSVQEEDLVDLYLKGLNEGKQDEKILLEMYREIMADKKKFGKRKIAFLPTPRQFRFLSASEDIVLYGGAAGGGKSHAMLMDALRYVHLPYYKAVIIRRTTPELGELIDNSRLLYPMLFPDCKFSSQNNTWRFPSGAQIIFGFLDRPDDKFKYIGKEFQYIGFDELSTQVNREGFDFVRSRLRTPHEGLKCYVRATANPGSMWVYEMFIKDKEPEVPFILPGTEKLSKPLTCKFIPAKLDDNPHLTRDDSYRAVLESMDEVTRKQYLEGDWLASADNMFTEFNVKEHVIHPFEIPRHWNRVAGLDYGYRDPSAGVWFAVDPSDDSIIVYDEFLERGLTGLEFAQAIKKKEEKEIMIVDHPIDWSIFAKTGHTGPTIAESMYQVPGMNLRPADKNREAGWVQIHELLRKDLKTGRPKVQIFSTCQGLIKQLISAKIHPTKPNDLNDTRNSDGHWDLLDAFRYGVMSRPRSLTHEDRLSSIKKQNSWDRINSYFK